MSEVNVLPFLRELPKRPKIWIPLAGALLLAALIPALVLHRGSGLHHFTAKVLRGDIHDAVEATGTVNAVINVQVGSQVSGTIAALNADFNSRVRKGDVIALIQPQLFEGDLKQATADLANAIANVAASKANLKKANAELEQMKAEYGREVTLAKEGVLSQQALDLAKANYESASASVDAASANVVQAQAQASQKRAAVGVARTNLDYTIIRSPINGVVVARNVDVGQTVAASLQAPTIFTIAQDLTKMLVYAKVDESDVGQIRMQQPVTFKVDAFPKRVFHGTVTQVRMNPTMIQNVVTYDAVIEFANPDMKLFPGMTAYVTIPTASAENVVKISNAALRYKPPMEPGVVRALYAKYGIDDTGKGVAGSASTGGAPPSPDSIPTRSQHAERAVVWKLLTDGSIQPVEIALGITDHTYTEVGQVVVGSLNPGDDAVTSSVASKSAPPGTQGMRR